MSDPSLEQILAVFDERPPAAHQVELSERGVVIHRMLLSQKDYRSIERLLSNRPLWVFDFSISPADLADNVHNGTELNPTYCGVIGPRGAPIFRVDHHYDVAALARESTTPLVRRWLLGLHEARLSAVLSTVSKGRYFANHWDVDIMLSHHLASMALDQAYLKTVGAWLADAALHNDYLEPPPASSEPQATQAYLAVRGMEEAIDAAQITYEEVQERWLPALGRWLQGMTCKGDDRTIESWVDSIRTAGSSLRARFDSWWHDGRLRMLHQDSIALLETNEDISNADLYLYLSNHPKLPRPKLQLLVKDVAGSNKVIYKVRSHGLDLNPILETLRQRACTSFGGRSAAGGSQPVTPCTDVVLDVLARALDTSPAIP